MQYITIGVARTRDMRTLGVRVQLRGVDGTPGSRSLYIGGVTYAAPFSMTTEQGIALGEKVLELITAELAQPARPF